jgi:hypothetical protein
MRPHDKARWLRPVNHDSLVEIPAAYLGKADCGEPVPSIIAGFEVDTEALCHNCAVELGLKW